MVKISDLGEFGFIADITARLPAGGAVVVGPGDDAAVVAVRHGRVVATTDLLLEGRHFRRDWSGPADIGAKAAARNLSDVAAMGAEPLALLVGFAAPGDLPLDWARDLVGGIAEEGTRGGAFVVGGDVSRAETVMLAVTALGELGGRDPVTRSGARPGDVLAVAGVLGHSAAGLALLSAGLAEPAGLVAAHRRPQPPYQAGPRAAALGATAMIDISDGLVGDLRHVADASGVRIDIETTALPTGGAVATAAAALGLAGPMEWVLAGGEDHALAATFPPATALPGEWTVIGRVLGGDGVSVDGRVAEGGGWDHFAQ